MVTPHEMPAPRCLAIIICESVVEDVHTHNKCILNTYNSVTAAEFPATHARMTVFASLTEGHGVVPMEMKVVRDEDQNELIKLNGRIDFRNPLNVVDVTVDMRNVPLPSEGSYAVQLLVNGELIGERRFRVTRAPLPPLPPAPPVQPA